MRYEDIHGKMVTLKHQDGRTRKLLVTGYGGPEAGVTFKHIDPSGWQLGGDEQTAHSLKRQGWIIPAIEVTNRRNQVLADMARNFHGRQTGQDEWKCSCGKYNSFKATTCPQCGNPSPRSGNMAESIVDSLLESEEPPKKIDYAKRLVALRKRRGELPDGSLDPEALRADECHA